MLLHQTLQCEILPSTDNLASLSCSDENSLAIVKYLSPQIGTDKQQTDILLYLYKNVLSYIKIIIVIHVHMQK